MNKITTIELKREVKKELDLICNKTETYSDLIKRLLLVFKKAMK